MSFRVEMMREPGTFPRARAIRAQFLETAAETIRACIREGDFRADLDAGAQPAEARVQVSSRVGPRVGQRWLGPRRLVVRRLLPCDR